MTRPVQCIDEQSLGESLALPASDPQRAHLESCPRCHALVVSYRAFLDPSNEEAMGYGTDEEDRLTAFRARMLGAPAPAAATEPQRSFNDAPGGSWWSKLFTPAVRPVWGLAAAMIVFGVLRFAGSPPAPPVEAPAPALRGAEPQGFMSAVPSYLPDGGVAFAWPSLAGAERYELRFYSTALTEVARRDAGTDTLATLALADLPEAYRGGEPVLFRVVALRGNDELESSAPASLKKP